MRRLIVFLMLVAMMPLAKAGERDSVIISLDTRRYYYFDNMGNDIPQEPSTYYAMTITKDKVIFMGIGKEPDMPVSFRNVYRRGNSYAFVLNDDTYVVMSLDKRSVIIYLFGRERFLFWIDMEATTQKNGNYFGT